MISRFRPRAICISRVPKKRREGGGRVNMVCHVGIIMVKRTYNFNGFSVFHVYKYESSYSRKFVSEF